MDANGTYLIWCRTIHLNIFNGKPRTFLLGIAWKLGHFGILQPMIIPNWKWENGLLRVIPMFIVPIKNPSEFGDFGNYSPWSKVKWIFPRCCYWIARTPTIPTCPWDSPRSGSWGQADPVERIQTPELIDDYRGGLFFPNMYMICIWYLIWYLNIISTNSTHLWFILGYNVLIIWYIMGYIASTERRPGIAHCHISPEMDKKMDGLPLVNGNEYWLILVNTG